MNGLVIGCFGIYFLLVGFKGNGSKLLSSVQADAPGFFPWAVSIGVLAVMYDNETTRRVAQPFIGLLIIAFVVQNFERLRTEFNTLQQMATGAANAPAAAPAPAADASQVSGDAAPVMVDGVNANPSVPQTGEQK